MTDRQFKPDLTGSDETLEHLLARLSALSKLRPVRGPGRDLPPDFGHFVTSRRPRGGAGGAEAPIPADRPAADLFAAV
jgi:hypothetical protein